MNSQLRRVSFFAMIGTVLVFLLGPALFGAAPAAKDEPLPVSGMGSLSGTVTAPKPFQAAKVYAHNLDKNVVYMVFTENGHYQAVDLFPGNYEVSVVKDGFTSPDTQKVTVAAGQNAAANFSLRDGVYRPNQQARLGIPKGEPLLPYDQLYPPGPGRDVAERTCIRCHGPDFLPNKQWDADQWNQAIDLMESTAPNSNPPGRITRTSVAQGLSDQDRQVLVDYLVKNFGPDSTPRGLAIGDEPIDEKALGKAEFIEYRLPPLPKNTGRRLHDAHLSQNGDVWYVDTAGLVIGKLDPRTDTFTDYPLPGPQYRGHGLTQDAHGDIWVAGHTAFVRIDSKSGEMQFYPYEKTPGERAPHGNTPMVDSKQNVWDTISWVNSIAKWDRKTGQVSTWLMPTPYSFPYGAVMDKHDNMWIAEWFACKIARFDTNAETFTEYSPHTKPCNMRRVFVDHTGLVWYAMDANGIIGSLDPATGRMVEYPEPVKYGFPYDIQEDKDENLWIADSGQGGSLIRFDPRTKQFTYYPAEQRTDMPKIEVSREGSIWYTTRGGDMKTMSLGVLYPDKSKIKTLGASY